MARERRNRSDIFVDLLLPILSVILKKTKKKKSEVPNLCVQAAYMHTYIHTCRYYDTGEIRFA